MRRILALIKKELIQLKRDPRLIGIIIAMPLILLLLFGKALKLEPDNVGLALVDNDHSFFSDMIRTAIWSEAYFNLYEVENKEAMLREIQSGRARAGVVIEAGFEAELTENEQPIVWMYVDGTMPSLATAIDAKKSIITDENVTGSMYFLDEDEENVIIAQDPFFLEVEILYNPDKKESWFFLPGVIGILITQVGLVLASAAVVREKEANTIEQIIVSPITRTEFILGKMLPYTIISFVDFFFILFFGWLLFDVPVPLSSIPLLTVLAFLFVICLSSMGLLISTISQTQQQAILFCVFILIPTILLSGFIFPLEAIPWYIRPFSYLLPFTYFVEIIRGLLLKSSELSDLLPHYFALFGFTILFTTLSINRFQKMIR